VEYLPPPVAAPPGTTKSSDGTGGGTTDDLQKIGTLIRRWAAARLKGAADDHVEDLYKQLFQLCERPLFETVLAKHHGQRAAAARTLGLHRMTLRKKLAEFGMEDL